jgi:NAD(P)-dependent dehydrogenase (short-subunit alcohol dehydrogenase family)
VVETTAQEWDNVINVNLRSVYLMSRQALKLMLPKKKGSIVNIASGWGLVGGGRAAAYCASKGGVVLLTKAMAIDHGPDGIRINCVCPGDTDTPMLRYEAQELGFSVDALLNAAHSRPLGRAGHPDEIAEAVVFLASPAASFITGAAMIVDGGSLAGSA